MDFDCLPDVLTCRSQWVAYRLEEREGKPTKVPYQPITGKKASATDPATWTDFQTVCTHLPDYDGPGYVFSRDDGLVGIDLDHALEDGRLLPWAQDIVDRLHSYSEISPSGTGLHVFVRGQLPTGRRRKDRIEMYSEGRYFTITGWHLPETPTTIEDRTQELADLHKFIFGEAAETVSHLTSAIRTGSDEALLKKAREAKNGDLFRLLFDYGDLSRYGNDESRADAALCQLLAFWTNSNAEQMDLLFRQSKLYRLKWDEKRGTRTYGNITIENACKNCTERYAPSEKQELPSHNSPISRDLELPYLKETPPPTPLDTTAYHGLAGEFVRLLEPHTEADPVAILIQFLAAYGSVIGRNAFAEVGATQHYPNIYAVIVGTSAKSRKTSSWDWVQRLMGAVDADWEAKRVQSGLSSGEGLIYAVRDPVEADEPIKVKGVITGYQRVVKDPGAEDKRLFILEPEFARTLKVAEREGCTLSPIIRQAWDSGNLRVLTKNPMLATNGHISIVGNITIDELRRLITDTAASNGFGNRFLWVYVRRSKLLPEGGSLTFNDLTPLVERLERSVDFGRKVRAVGRDIEAKEAWAKVYPQLTEEVPGLFGSLTARAEAQALRLSCLYALLDCSEKVRREHLAAALALWKYAEDSVRYIFRDALGDPLADDILRALRANPKGLTRTEISSLFGRHESIKRLNPALLLLLQRKLATVEKVSSEGENGRGRDIELWKATG